MVVRSIMLVCAIVLVSCGPQRSTIGDGMVQKRVHQRGWHMDLHGFWNAHHAPLSDKRGDRKKESDDGDIVLRSGPEIRPTVDLFASVTTGSLEDGAVGRKANIRVDHRSAPEPFPQDAVTGVPDQEGEQENIMPRKKINALALPALILVLGAVALALFGNNAWLVAAVLLVGIVVALMSLWRIREKEQSGKGYALVALVIGTVGMVLTAMAIVRTEF